MLLTAGSTRTAARVWSLAFSWDMLQSACPMERRSPLVGFQAAQHFAGRAFGHATEEALTMPAHRLGQTECREWPKSRAGLSPRVAGEKHAPRGTHFRRTCKFRKTGCLRAARQRCFSPIQPNFAGPSSACPRERPVGLGARRASKFIIRSDAPTYSRLVGAHLHWTQSGVRYSMNKLTPGADASC
jgi:hypothetical protein